MYNQELLGIDRKCDDKNKDDSAFPLRVESIFTGFYSYLWKRYIPKIAARLALCSGYTLAVFAVSRSVCHELFNTRPLILQDSHVWLKN